MGTQLIFWNHLFLLYCIDANYSTTNHHKSPHRFLTHHFTSLFISPFFASQPQPLSSHVAIDGVRFSRITRPSHGWYSLNIKLWQFPLPLSPHPKTDDVTQLNKPCCVYQCYTIVGWREIKMIKFQNECFSDKCDFLRLNTQISSPKLVFFVRQSSHSKLKVTNQKPESKTNKESNSGGSGWSKSGDCDRWYWDCMVRILKYTLKKL